MVADLESKMSNGLAFSIDDSDSWVLSLCNWFCAKKSNKNYVAGNLFDEGSKSLKRAYLHRVILGDECNGLVVDHIDGNPLNNHRSNLRAVTHQENLRNRPNVVKNTTSGFRGVNWHKQRGKWNAVIKHNGKKISLGLYLDINDAVNARIKKEKELWSSEDCFQSNIDRIKIGFKHSEQ